MYDGFWLLAGGIVAVPPGLIVAGYLYGVVTDATPLGLEEGETNE